MGKQWKLLQTLFIWAPKSLQMVTTAMKLEDAPWKKSYDQPREHIQKQRYYFANKGPSSQSYGFSLSHEWMWELDYKESWALKNWCLWTVVLEKTLQSPLDCKEIQPVHPKGDQSWIFIGRTDVEAETPILWPPDAKSWLIWKRPWHWERLKAEGEEDDRGWDGWMASLTQGHELDQTPGHCEEQRSLACCSPWDHKESDTTERLNLSWNWIRERSIPAVWGKGWRFPGNGPLPTFWPLLVDLRTVLAPVGVSFRC